MGPLREWLSCLQLSHVQCHAAEVVINDREWTTQYDSIVLDGKQLLAGKLPGFHKMWYNACHAAKQSGGSFKGMSMSSQVRFQRTPSQSRLQHLCIVRRRL